MNVAIIQFPGTNCDIDTYRVFSNLLKVDVSFVWHKENDLTNFDAVVLPGGFSYGDRLRAGVIAAHSPVIQALKKFALKRKPIIGICNGVQILVESELLPGALLKNSNQKFVCKWVTLKVENNNNIFANYFKSDSIIRMPIAHNEGRYYVDNEKLEELERNNQIVLRYVDSTGNASIQSNPNGSISNIAAVSNIEGNVLGLMPHPERASESILSPDSSTNGIGLFHSMIHSLEVILKK